MQNPLDPTDAEIRSWAYDVEAVEPVQDWDLIIWGLADPNLLAELASDSGCPTQSYFLSCLYGRVGDEVRTGRVEDSTWDSLSTTTGVLVGSLEARIPGRSRPPSNESSNEWAVIRRYPQALADTA